jgi:pyridoxal phosphate enzyme (YggS family)
MSAQNQKDGTAAARLAEITSRMKAAQGAHAPVLVAVSKTFDADAIAPLIAAGQRVFGENRVQEAAAKWPALKARTPDIELHLIGPLQTNKLKQALALFDVIHTLDRPRLAAALVKARDEGAQLPRLFIQVNTGAEPQKAGVLPDEAETFIAQCCDDADLPVIGLMCIPPADDDPAPHFDMLAGLAARTGLPNLSMGMSADFELAIRHGATHVRVGSALFGRR